MAAQNEVEVVPLVFHVFAHGIYYVHRFDTGGQHWLACDEIEIVHQLSVWLKSSGEPVAYLHPIGADGPDAEREQQWRDWCEWRQREPRAAQIVRGFREEAAEWALENSAA